jgi:choline dehydrogenase-like flavoprotein
VVDLQETDVLVVGAGPAGSVIAARLAEAGRRVLLIDQGGEYPITVRRQILDQREQRLLSALGVDFGAELPADFRNPPVASPQPHPWSYTSSSGAGGASLHWNAHAPRPTAEDLETQRLFGYGRDWPIAYDELEPYLLEAEREVGVAANADNPYASPRSAGFPMPAHAPSHFEHSVMTPAFERLGWTAHTRPNAINSRPYRGRSQCQACRACTACPSGARYAADLVHVRRFAEQPTAGLVTGLKLRRLEVGRDGRRVRAAHCVRMADRAELVIEAATVVLALNGIETPRMLLLSGDPVHHPGGLGNRGGQLGRGFSDHIMSFCWFELAAPVGRGLGYPSLNCDRFRDRAQRDERGSFSINLQPMPSEVDWVPAAMMRDLMVSGDQLTLADLRRGLQRAVVGWTIHELSGAGGSLALDAQHADGFGDPLARVTLSPGEWDLAGLDVVAALEADVAGALGARRHWNGGPRDHGFAAHPSGATAMGASPDTGVCDRDARVFGVDNLYLASSSVFPHQGAANPTLTIVALALRLADHLASQAGRS